MQILRPLSTIVLVALTACAVGGPLTGGDGEGEDGGRGLGCPDGGLCDPVEAPQSGSAPARCADLVEKVCGEGAGPSCDDAPACEAARLLQRYEEQRCVEALADEVTFPACAYDACEQLVQKVCGALFSPAACEDAPGCEPARRLLERARGDDAGERQRALESCQSSLRDDVVFAGCS